MGEMKWQNKEIKRGVKFVKRNAKSEIKPAKTDGKH